MQLQTLDFEKYIAANKVLQVKSYKIPSQTYDEDGLWSESIFGKIGSKDRLLKFGYVDLTREFIHPALYDMISTVSEQTSKIIRNKEFYIVEDGKYKSDPHGKTGIEFLISSIKEVKFSKFCHKHKKEIAKYLDGTKITINKFLIQPAGLRDIDIYNKSGGRLQIDEVNNLYTKLLIYIEQLTGIEDLDDITNKKIQMQLNEIYKFIQDKRLKGKKGLFRGTMLSKTMDYSTRLVLTNDPDVPLGYIGLPWHTLSSIFEPFMIHYLFKRESENSSINLDVLRKYANNEKLDPNSFPKLNREITNNPDIVPKEVKNIISDTLNSFLDDQVVMVKRDPVQQRNSWFSATPMIMEGRVAYVNSLDLGPIQGDCVKGDVILFKRNERGDFVRYTCPIDNFHEYHNVTLINNRTRKHPVTGDEIEVHEFRVDDDVYSIGLDEKTNLFKHCKIMNWSIHNNINLYRMTIFGEDIIISENKSCYVIDSLDNSYKKLDISEVLDAPNRYEFIYSNLNTFDVKFIPAADILFAKYDSPHTINIKISKFNIDIDAIDSKIAYDFTIEDDHVRSFLHSSMVVQCNSDGDTIAILPVFSNEAKKEVKYKMNPAHNKNKWNSPISYNNIIYSPTLDTISAIYNATRA